MSDLNAAAREALEALESLQGGCTDSNDGTVEAITVWCPEVIERLRAALAAPQQAAQPVAQDWRDHVEQQIRSWRQRTMNKSGDHLAIDDFMSGEDVDDLVDFVCDEWAGPAPAKSSFVAPSVSQPVAIPEGWRLVPVEPTPEMVRAGWKHHPSAFGDEFVPAMYRAMLAAAPRQAKFSAAPPAPPAERAHDELSLDDDGDVSLDWHVGDTNGGDLILSMSVDVTGRIAYAWRAPSCGLDMPAGSGTMLSHPALHTILKAALKATQEPTR